MLRSPRKPKAQAPVDVFYLSELEFWLEILKEHTIFIKAGLPADQSDLRRDVAKFKEEIECLQLKLKKIKTSRQLQEFIADAICIVKEFYLFQRRLVLLMLCCKLMGNSFPFLIDHLAREAEYVLHFMEYIRDSTISFEYDPSGELVFWLRLMADHAKFICHLLDPSERALLETAQNFSDEFDDLYLQGRDFDSMLYQRKAVPAFCRFIQDVKVSTVMLKDFKRAARELIKNCRLIGLIPEQLANHIYCEAEHFIGILAKLEKMLHISSCCSSPAQPVECVQQAAEGEAELAKTEDTEEDEKIKIDEKPEPEECSTACHNTSDDEYDDVDDDADCQPLPKSQAKYSWNNWPKPIGK